MIPTSLWYRHWMEMRNGFWVASGCAAILCLAYPFLLHGSTSWFEDSGKIIKELSAVAPQLPAMGPARFLPWGVHLMISASAAVIIGIFLGGTGLRTNSFQPRHPSAYYTLTLPVSRFDLIWTRFGSACAAVYVLLAAMLVLDCFMLLIMGRAIPLGAMAASSFLAALLAAPVLAVFAVLTPLWNEQISGFLFVVGILAGFRAGWTPISSFIGSPAIPWQPIGVIFLVVGAALSLSGIVAQKRDFFS